MPLDFTPEDLSVIDLRIGWGAETTGGDGGRIVRVTNLSGNAAVIGSLPYYLVGAGAFGTRRIQFDVSGIIALGDQLQMRGDGSFDHGNVTVEGETSPDGIIVTGGRIRIRVDQVIIRGLTIAPGDDFPGQNGDDRDCISVGDGSTVVRHVIIDGNTLIFSTDEALTSWGPNEKITFSRNIIAEALDDSIHSQGDHGYGVLVGAPNGTQSADGITICLNYIASHDYRLPLVKEDARKVEIYNNYFYNWGTWCTEFYENCTANIIGNVYERGPDSSPPNAPIRLSDPGGTTAYYLDDNTYQDGAAVDQTGAALANVQSTPVFTPTFTPMAASDLIAFITDQVGARPGDRSDIGRRLITKNTRIIDVPDDTRLNGQTQASRLAGQDGTTGYDYIHPDSTGGGTARTATSGSDTGGGDTGGGDTGGGDTGGGDTGGGDTGGGDTGGGDTGGGDTGGGDTGGGDTGGGDTGGNTGSNNNTDTSDGASSGSSNSTGGSTVANGVRTTQFDPADAIDELLGNFSGSVKRISAEKLSSQLAASGPIAGRLDAAESARASAEVIEAAKTAALLAAASEGVFTSGDAISDGIAATSDGQSFIATNASGQVLLLQNTNGTADVKGVLRDDVADARVQVQGRSVGTGIIAANELVANGWINDNPLEIREFVGWVTSGSQRYVVDPARNNDRPYLKTVNDGIDQELKTWARKGTVFFRLADDRALYINMEADLNPPRINVGMRTGVETGTVADKWFERYDFLADAQALGYDALATEGDEWTFGISGVDLYVDYNGRRLKTFKKWGFYQMQPGSIAVMSPDTYGFRDLKALQKPDPNLASDFRNGILDMGDMGMKDLVATGSMVAGSDQLTLGANPGYQIGDTVIVGIGGEAGRGQLGTKGVGGTWPTLSYADLATMNADTGQGSNTVAWCEDTGITYQFVNSNWGARTQTAFYTYKAIPLSLVAKVVAISGNVLTLDQDANVSTDNAVVYFGNTAEITDFVLGGVYPGSGSGAFDWLPKKLTVRIPAGRFAMTEPINLFTDQRDDWSIVGLGKKVSTIFSPNGVQSVSLKVQNAANVVLKNFGVEGNVRKSGFGFSDAVMRAEVQDRYPSGVQYPQSVHGLGVERMLVTDLYVKDVWQGGVLFSTGCADCWGERVEFEMTDGLFQYIQWPYQVADSTRGGFRECTFYSPILNAGMEAFRSTGVRFERNVLRNGAIAINSSGDWIMEDNVIILDEECVAANGSWSENNPIININTNIQPPHPDLLLGGVIRRQSVIMRDPLSETGYAGMMININAGNENVTVEGSYDGETLHRPDIMIGPNAGASGPIQRGAIGVNSTAPNTIVRNIRVRGTSPKEATGTGYANININGAGSQVIDCVADEVFVAGGATATGTRTNAQYGVGP